MDEPFELLELTDGQSAQLAVERWQLGRTFIQPRDGRAGKDVPILRVWVPERDKATLPHYWDLSSKHLIAGLLGYLETRPERRYRFTIRKRGRGPAARYELTATPVSP